MKLTQTTRATELAYSTPYLDPGINRLRWNPVRVNGSKLTQYSYESFVWRTCDIQMQTLSERCISLNCNDAPRRFPSKLMSRLKQQEKQFENHTSYTVISLGLRTNYPFLFPLNLGIFICRRRPVSISGNSIFWPVSVSTIAHIQRKQTTQLFICPSFVYSVKNAILLDCFFIASSWF